MIGYYKAMPAFDLLRATNAPPPSKTRCCQTSMPRYRAILRPGLHIHLAPFIPQKYNTAGKALECLDAVYHSALITSERVCKCSASSELWLPTSLAGYSKATQLGAR